MMHFFIKHVQVSYQLWVKVHQDNVDFVSIYVEIHYPSPGKMLGGCRAIVSVVEQWCLNTFLTEKKNNSYENTTFCKFI